MKTANFFFQQCFYKCKKERENTPGLELNRNEVKPGRSCCHDFDTFLHQCVADGRKWRFLCFSCQTVVSPDSVSSLRFNLLILDWFCWKEWKRTALFLLFPTVQLGRYFNATAGHKTKVVVGKEHDSCQHTGAQGSSTFKCKDLPFYHWSHSNWNTLLFTVSTIHTFFETQTMWFVTIQHFVVFIFPIFGGLFYLVIMNICSNYWHVTNWIVV